MQRTYDKDPYAILGIPPTATASQVKQAYHRLARQFHPDLNKDPRAVERMKDINWANSILSDAQERAHYDMWRMSSSRTAYHPGTPPPPTTPPHRSSSPPPTPGERARSSPPPNPPPRTVSSTGRSTQGQWAQGCSPATFVIIIVILLNVMRSVSSASKPIQSYPAVNAATQTVRWETLMPAMETLCVSQGVSNRCGTFFPSLLYGTLLVPSSTATITPPPLYETLLVSPTVTILTDEFGHPDLRASIVPGSWEWGQINHYFPHLTALDGLGDEVTLVTYDQLRGYRIQTQNEGEYWLFVNVYDNSIQPAHFTPTATPGLSYGTILDSSPTTTILMDEFGHEDLRPGIVPGSQEWEWINTYFPDLTTPDGLTDEVTFVFWDQNRRGIVIETVQSGLYVISVYGGNVTAWHESLDVPAPAATAVKSPAP